MAVFLLGQRLGRVGLWATAFFVLFPGPYVTRAMLGFSDHHVAECLLAVLTLLGIVFCYEVACQPNSLRWWRPALLAGPAPRSVSVHLAGSTGLLVIVGVVFVLIGLLELASRGRSAMWAVFCARYGGGVFLITLLIGVLIPNLVMQQRRISFEFDGQRRIAVILSFTFYLADYFTS